MNASIILFGLLVIFITVTNGEKIGKCVGGFCPEGFTCNAEEDCISINPPCIDENESDCISLTYLCNNGIYNDLMTETCAKTCGRCA